MSIEFGNGIPTTASTSAGAQVFAGARRGRFDRGWARSSQRYKFARILLSIREAERMQAGDCFRLKKGESVPRSAAGADAIDGILHLPFASLRQRLLSFPFRGAHLRGDRVETGRRRRHRSGTPSSPDPGTMMGRPRIVIAGPNANESQLLRAIK